MVEIASQIVICLVIAAFIGFLIGFLIGRAFGGDRTSIFNSNSTASYGAVQANIYNKPLIRSTPRPTGKDNLQEIEGIDKELESKLNELGIYHFDQIAKWNAKNCHWVEEYFTLEDNQVKEANWIEQAQGLSKI
ncbi:hypothetical protein [Arcobacter sp. LA11]|uniref:hypothetical protein n=1 Tax=Arcobacter sp. LA11 TaxID=1898176 RepID=UPI0009343EF1|nr:hypothetical protein [Arcobacter sp. LA11]